MSYTDKFSEKQYEGMAKRMADILLFGNGKGDEIEAAAAIKTFNRVTNGCREKAHKLLIDIGHHVNDGPTKLVLFDSEDFRDMVLAFAIGGGCEIEWRFDTIEEWKNR